MSGLTYVAQRPADARNHALLPAFLFLATLLLLDSFKLVRPATVGAAVLYGAIAASACAALHEWIARRDLDLAADVHAIRLASARKKPPRRSSSRFCSGAGGSDSSWMPRCWALPSAPASRSSRT